MRHILLAMGLLLLAACASPPPHAVVSVEDPLEIAAAAVTLEIGSEPASLKSIPLDGNSLPATVTLTSAASAEKNLWFDALDAEGTIVGRTRATIEFSRKRGSSETVELGPPCEGDADCGDGVFCNGDEICIDRVCAVGEIPCPPSPFGCVAVGCVEAAQLCDITVDHTVCDPIAVPEGGTEPTYCDTAAGCVRGTGCQEATGDADCADGIFCNGVEGCIANRCVAGIPPAVDDDNPCTIDFCAEEVEGEAHIQAPDGNSCELAPPETCSDATCPGACVDDQCVGVCFEGICAASGCGDGFHDPLVALEECDDGNMIDTDACTNSCTISFCGDQRVFDSASGGFEVCDNGSQCSEGTDCSGDPTLCAGVGDGSCLPRDGDGCRADCLKVEVCGDGILDANEDCDDGNTDNPNDGCASCRQVVWDAQVRFGFGEGGGDPFQTPLGEPTMIASDRDGNFYLYEPRWGLLRRYVSDGTGTRYIPQAGNGNLLIQGEDGPATSATITVALGLDIDGFGNLIIADTGNNRIRRVNVRTGYIETIAGTTAPGLALYGAPAPGDGGPALNADLYLPGGLEIDGQANIYFSDEGNDRIRRIDGKTGIITTIAGVGEGPYCDGGGVAALACLDDPNDVAIDHKGRILIADSANYLVRRVDVEAGTIENIAGTPGMGDGSGFGDGGPALSARLGTTYGMAVDSTGKVFVTDVNDDTIRMIDTSVSDDPNDYTIVRIACSGFEAYSLGGGVARNADCDNPWGIDVDGSDNVLFADEDNNYVRRLSDPDGDGAYSIETVAGNGAAFVGDLTDSVVTVPYVLREAPGAVGVLLPPDLTDLANIEMGDINLYLADFDRNRVMVINRSTNEYFELAGTGEYGFVGDGGPATVAELAYPRGVIVDINDVVYIADRDNHRIRRVNPLDGSIDTVAGTGSPGFNADGIQADTAMLNSPSAVVIGDNGDLLIADSANHRVRRVSFGLDPFDPTDNIITTAVGTGSPGYNADGSGVCYAPLTDCELNEPVGLFALPLTALSTEVTGDLIFIADRANHRVRLYLDALYCALPNPTPPPDCSVEVPLVQVLTIAGDGNRGFAPGMHADATQTSMEFPRAVFPHLDPACGLCMLAADGIDRVRVIDMNFNPPFALTTGIDTILGDVSPEPDGTFDDAILRSPEDLFGLDDDRWLVADRSTGHLRLVNVDLNVVSTVVGFPEGAEDDSGPVPARDRNTFKSPRAFAYDGGSSPPALYVANSRVHTVSKVLLVDTGDPLTWTSEHLMGKRQLPGHRDGPVADAELNLPSGLAFDSGQRLLFIAEEGNHTVRAVDVDNPTGVNAVRTIAGTPAVLGYYGDGIEPTDAVFNRPSGLALAGNYLYIADTGNHRVRLVTNPGGGLAAINTVLGDGEAASGGFGEPARAFPVNNPTGLTVDSHGNLFVASRNAIRLVSAGSDGLATGNDFVSTIYGAVPRDTFPESVTTCLTGIGLVSGEDRIFFLDNCLGFFMQLDRRLVNP